MSPMMSPARRRVLGHLTTLGAALALVIGSAGASSAQPPAPAPPRPAAPAPAPAPAAHTVTYDDYSFMIDGKRVYLWSGEVHDFRLPSPGLWPDIFQKMKAAGFNTVSVYFDWGYHSSAPGEYDFTGIRDVDAMLDDAQQAGLYVIARPGPYINAEVDGGGFPAWLSTTPAKLRSDDPTYLGYADQWMHRIDEIIARHQLTNGTGTVIEDQIENEYWGHTDPDGRAYMQHLEQLARADGITVPLVGNNNGTFNSGVGALDVDAVDSYPQGFDCSDPARWNGVPDISFDHPPGRPIVTSEFQGGAFDPWGGPGYDKCAQLTDERFANVFYQQNIAVGATSQSFYMLYGGTNWGWLGMPENYTSYDYGAAIRETRELTAKYQQDKLIGDFTQAVAPLTKTDAITTTDPDDPAVVDTARENPDTGTQFHVLRHGDATSTSTDTTHVSVDLGAQPRSTASYTHDDVDPALQYSDGWTHVADQGYTDGDYRGTETFSATKGDSVTVPFTGTAVRWIGSKVAGHGLADVFVDGVAQGTVDEYGTGQKQAVVFAKAGLAAGPHTLEIVVDGAHGASSDDDFVSVDAIDVPTGDGAAPTYPTVPQQPGTAITLDGRDSHIIVADYQLGQTQMQYSTSEIMTDATIGGRDVAVLYGDEGSDGETVLNVRTRPTVTTTGAAVQQTWDATTGDLRLNYRHRGLARVEVTEPGRRPLLLLLADRATAETFWTQDTAAGPVLVRGTRLLRTATSGDGGKALALTGDNDEDNGIEVFTGASTVTWNGARLHSRLSSTGSRVAVIPVARDVTLPQLTGWKHVQGSPESQPGFDDASWPVADKTTSNVMEAPAGQTVLDADDYGFHTGSTWYRGRFTGNTATGVTLDSQSGGKAAASSVWLNGVFLGSSTHDGSTTYTFPAGSLEATGDNVLSVLTVDMGHEEGYRAARGLTSASLVGGPLSSITWRVQGVRGGENQIDPVRGPLSTGGLFGERAGYPLPGYPTRGWAPVSLPAKDTTPGVSWYTTTARLDLPKDQDTSVGLTIDDDPARQYRAEVFVNGWHLGNDVSYLGPQHSFPIPDGILRTRGENTVTIAVWNLDGSTGGLGKVSLTSYGSHLSPMRVTDADSPGYDRARYAMPRAPRSAVALHVPGSVAAGQTFTATTTVTVAKGAPAARSVTASLGAPAGWTVSRQPTPARIDRIRGGTSATFAWQVTAGATVDKTNALTTTVHAVQGRRAVTLQDERIAGYVPPTPPGGVSQVSDLPWLSSTNGWGPVERDTSNGEQAAGDGRPITIAGTVHAKGLGTNAVSDVTVYLGGRCTRFSATVGADDEQAATVTFSVVADGRTLAATDLVDRASGPKDVTADLTGAQVLDLVVGDGGNGDGGDHADWADPEITCTG